MFSTFLWLQLHIWAELKLAATHRTVLFYPLHHLQSQPTHQRASWGTYTSRKLSTTCYQVMLSFQKTVKWMFTPLLKRASFCQIPWCPHDRANLLGWLPCSHGQWGSSVGLSSGTKLQHSRKLVSWMFSKFIQVLPNLLLGREKNCMGSCTLLRAAHDPSGLL